MGANVGIPVANLDKSSPIWILETSSFTIHYTKRATPEIYALLPITPDHLSWHGSFQEYENAKLKPFFMMKNGVAFAPKCYENRLKDCAVKIYFYENQDLSSVLESLDEYSLSEEVEISLILHFSYFKIEGMETDYGDNNIKNIENSTPQKLYNKFLFIFFILKAFK